MFHKTITASDGTTTEGMCTDQNAANVIRVALRRGYGVTATLQGGAVITRPVGRGIRTIELEPETPVGKITSTMRGDLDAIAPKDSGYRVDVAEQPFEPRAGRMFFAFYSIPRAASAKLVERGLVMLGEPVQATSNGLMPETRRPVALSLSARLVMLALDGEAVTAARLPAN